MYNCINRYKCMYIKKWEEKHKNILNLETKNINVNKKNQQE